MKRRGDAANGRTKRKPPLSPAALTGETNVVFKATPRPADPQADHTARDTGRAAPQSPTGDRGSPRDKNKEPVIPDHGFESGQTGDRGSPVSDWDLWAIQTRLVELLAPNPDARAVHFAIAKEIVLFGEHGFHMRPTTRTLGNRTAYECRAVKDALRALESWGLLVATRRQVGRETEYCIGATVRERPGRSLRGVLRTRESLAERSARRSVSPQLRRVRRAAQAIKHTAYLPPRTKIADEGDRFTHEVTLDLYGRANRVLSGADVHALDDVLGECDEPTVKPQLRGSNSTEQYGCLHCHDVGCSRCGV